VSAAIKEVRVEVEARSPFSLPRHGGLDGLTRVRGGVVHRLVHVDERPVVVRVASLGRGRALFGAAAATRTAALIGIARMRQALGVDHDLAGFYARFRFDPLIGRAVRSDPGFRVVGRPDAFEALTWAICEQLIESERAAEIQRALTFRLGRRCLRTGLRDAPAAAMIAGQSPARLESLGLSGLRAITLTRAAREVAAGRIDLYGPHHEHGWRRLRAIPGIGSWTVQKLALEGQGRMDQIPAGDLAYLKLVGRLLSGGDPRARASEQEVEDFFAPYAPWAGLAGAYALRSSKATVSHRALARASASSASLA
jgi:3-methyladenine DNA glycosylase/8-oxoguanine DNA glycosylase